MPVLRARNSAGFEAPAALTADPVILAPLAGRLCVLLVRRSEEPFAGRWALPGGFLSPSERPEETAQRKLTEKTGVGTVYLEQLATYGEPARDPRGWIPSIAYLALIDAAVLQQPAQGSPRSGSTPAAPPSAEARWWPVDDLPPVAFDHGTIVADSVERLRGKLWYSNIAVGLLPERFTMTQARRLYEEISGVRHEASNFRRELEGSGLVRATGEVVKGVPGRPAALYEFVERRPQWSLRRSRHPAVAGADGTGRRRRTVPVRG